MSTYIVFILIILALFPLFNCIGYLEFTFPDQPHLSVPFSIANFGQVPYGKFFIGDLHVSLPLNACTFPQYTHSRFKNQTKPFVFLAFRGNCSFLTKAYVAQALGASMLLVVDNILQMTENITPMSVTDDDTSNLTIPTLFIAKNDGDYLLEKYQTSIVRVNVSFVFYRSNKVNYTFWLTNSQPQSIRLVASFKDFYLRFNESREEISQFEAHYTGLFHCKFCNLTNYTYFPDNCISGGRYCSGYPEGTNSSSAMNYIYEDLRQICIYKHSIPAWWKYLSKFAKRCLGDPKNYENCSNILLQKIEKKLNLPNFPQIITECFKKSFIVSEFDGQINPLFQDNILLRDERKISIAKAIGFWPSVVINDQVYKGNLAGNLIFSAICETFERMPKVCFQLEFDESESFYINQNIIIMVLMMVALIATFFLVSYCTKYKKIKESKVRSVEISEIIGKYHFLHNDA